MTRLDDREESAIDLAVELVALRSTWVAEGGLADELMLRAIAGAVAQASVDTYMAAAVVTQLMTIASELLMVVSNETGRQRSELLERIPKLLRDSRPAGPVEG